MNNPFLPSIVVNRFRRETSPTSGGHYYRFNVYLEFGPVRFISLGWRWQNDKIAAPATKGAKGFYSTMIVSEEVAKGIYKEALRQVSEIEGRHIEWSDKGWKAPKIGETSFARTMPEYFQEKYGWKYNRAEPVVEDYEDLEPEPPPTLSPVKRFTIDYVAKIGEYQEKYQQEKPPGCPPGVTLTDAEVYEKWQAYESYMNA